MHLGILRTDNVLPQFQSDYGDYPQMFEDLFRSVEPHLRFTSYDVRERIPTDIDCDAYVITGSRHSVYDDLPWIADLVQFLRQVLDAGRPIIGICFGHQLMAHFFGGEVSPAQAGWAVGVHTSEVTAVQTWMPSAEQSFSLLSSHKDQVTKVPPGAQVYLSNAFCPVSGFTLGDKIITVQGHPEFSKPYARSLMDYRRELLGERVYAAGVNSLDEELDAVVMARWLLAFVRQARTEAQT